ncbi:MAG: SsrA-binding protein SmpB [Patescibacteria group bacterium]
MIVFAENRKAKFDYTVLEPFDAGLVLTGYETKAVREGGAALVGSYLSFDKGELWLIHARIAPYSKMGKKEGVDPLRRRKVLLHTRELTKIFGKLQQKGLTLIPFSLYPRGRQIKLSFGLCRGKHEHDKRETIKRRDIDRETRSEI